MGFNFKPDFYTFLIQRSDPKNHKKMTIDQFIVTCVRIQRFTEEFKKKDTQQTGIITIGFEDCLTIALECT